METVSFTKGSGVLTKDQERERKLWKLLVLQRDQVCQLKIKRENVLHVETVSFKEQMSTKDRKRERESHGYY